MTTIASIAEIQRAGVTLEAGEAVAVALQLIQTLQRSDDTGLLQPPYGPPTASNVILNADGSVTCAACGTTPAISEIAIFLDTLLPAGSPRVPGGLRYAIARGMLEVDVAPFDSLDDFSLALMRHERGPRGEVLRRLLRRAESARAAVSGARAERRRAGTTQLRRDLREADARLYAQQLAVARPMAPPPIRPRTVPAIAACLGSGLMLIAAGEFMRCRPAPAPVAAPAAAPVAAAAAGTRPATPMAPALPPNERAAGARAGGSATVARGLQAGGGASTRPVSSTRPVRGVRVMPGEPDAKDRTSVKRAADASAAGVSKARPQRTTPGVLDRLRLGWLRHAFSVRADEL